MKLLDQITEKCQRLGYSRATAKTYRHWVEKFVRFHRSPSKWVHPRDLTAKDVERFLTHLAVNRRVSATTQNVALNAIVFLYKRVLQIDLGKFDAVRAKRPKVLPTVLAPSEVRRLLAEMSEPYLLMAELMYGAGLRVSEVCRLRVKDIDLDARRIFVRQAKGAKDRATVLPPSLVDPLERQLIYVESLHAADVRRGVASVALPNAFAAKSPTASAALAWYFVFAAAACAPCRNCSDTVTCAPR